MSAIAVGAQVRTRRLRVAIASRDTLAVFSVSALFLLLAALTWNAWGDIGRDTGYDLVAGTLVSHGHLPYVDFVYYYGPFAPMLLGLVLLIGGSGLAPAIGLGLVVSYAIVLAAYALGRTQSGPLGAGLAAAITAAVAFSPTNLSFVLPHTYSATLAVIFTLGFLLALHRSQVTKRSRWLVTAGLLAGAVALTRAEFTLAVVVATALWLWVVRRAGMRGAQVAVPLIAPAVVLPAAVYGSFLTSVSPHRLVFENLYPVAQMRAAGNHVLRIDAPLTIASFASLGAKLCLYALGVVVLVVLARAIDTPRTRTATLCVVAVGTVAAVVLSLLRPETLRYGLEFAYGWIPAGAALATIVLARRARRTGTPSDGVALACAAVLTVLAARSYAGFYFHSPRAQAAVYAAPFAAVLLARLHLTELAGSRSARVLGAMWLAFLAAAGTGLALKDAHAKSGRVTGPGGALRAAPSDARVYQSALGWIEADSAHGGPVLLAPQLTALYTLSGRDDPLRQISLLPGALPTRSDQLRAIAQLEREQVRLAIIDRRAFSEYGHGPFGTTFDRVLAAWIHSTFTHIATLGHPGTRMLDVWLKRGAS